MKPEMVPYESVPEKEDISPSQSQIAADCIIQRNQKADSHLTSFTLSDDRKRISGMEAEHQAKAPVKDANVLAKNVSEDANRISEIQRRSIPDGFKSVVLDDMQKNGSPTLLKTDQVEQHISLGTNVPPTLKYTTSERWIMEQQKRKFEIEQNWALKQKKTDQRIAACSEKLKMNILTASYGKDQGKVKFTALEDFKQGKKAKGLSMAGFGNWRSHISHLS
ncbi:hypothetical protein Vadar_033633 [Vaccinium darrowii]|uniref:Uncharacterized protein n=1 Tax=Vaccinium darrowii TaxID=229202 RepID=A0ACB7XLU5_9ERIC|nr:hypothetical protein Vadar_033633 [Vaccinium darrowii]